MLMFRDKGFHDFEIEMIFQEKKVYVFQLPNFALSFYG